MYSMVKDWRNNKGNMYNPSRYSVENYFTDVQQKREMKHSFGEDLLNNYHLLPDPLKKNLADSIITHSEETKPKASKIFLNAEKVDSGTAEVKAPPTPEEPQMAPLSGITGFITGVMNVLSGAMFHWRARSPPKYHDCFDESDASRQGSPPRWQPASPDDQNKNERAHGLISNVQTELNSNMNKDCRSAAAHCEDKLNKVRLLLSSKPVETPKYRSRRPRKVFVEPGSVEETFEDAFSPEDFVSLSNDPAIEYYSPYQCHQEELHQTDSPTMRTRVAPVHENTNIVETLPVVEISDKNCIVVKSDNLNSKPEVSDKMEIVNKSNSEVENKHNLNMKLEEAGEKINIPTDTDNVPINKDSTEVVNLKEQLVLSCEDKLSKLKALLQSKKQSQNIRSTIQSASSETELVDTTNDKVQKISKTVPIEKTQDKHFKNPCRRTDKRKKTRMRKHIHDDMMFAHEINSEDISSVENSPSINTLDKHVIECLRKTTQDAVTNSLSVTPVSTPKCSVTPPSINDTEYFDEVSGRFRSTSTTDSEDSFQIVFSDRPKTHKTRLPSDCESEDSFIVFEDSPDSCYTTNDVFGEDSEEESDYSDSDSDVSDSGCVSKLAHNLSRTIGDLTDTSLYEETCDEVDCAVRSVCEEIPNDDILDVGEDSCVKTEETGLLLTEAKKLLRKDQPPKKVQFSPRPAEVRVMRVWAFAARQARVGHWERFARDRDRFKRRIADVDMAISWVLKPQHRSRVMFQRFMPWWNAQKRKEIAERKQKKEEDERRLAEEKQKEEERLRLEAKKKELGIDDDDNQVAIDDGNLNLQEKEQVNVDPESKINTDSASNILQESDSVQNIGDKTTNLQETEHAIVKETENKPTGDGNIKNVLQESDLKVVCNGVHIPVKDSPKIDVQSGNINVKEISTKVEINKDAICIKVAGNCINTEIKEQKHNVTKTNNVIRDSKVDKSGTKTAPIKIQNRKIPKDMYKKFNKEKTVNSKLKEITLDLHKQNVSDT